ncbi:MAG: superoxide dismutase family protein [Alphaproteobacteria bacterium]|nr:superoxide dismutase family protein [Alphaproteobacteria bacterium]
MGKRDLVAALVALCAAAGTAQAAETARATMVDVQGRPLGAIELRQTPQGVLLSGRLAGLPPGPHAFHLHAVGKCEPPFATAEGHFNPGGRKHGYFAAEGAHAGDLPNLHVAASGEVSFDLLAPGLNLAAGAANGLFDADGSAFIVHAGADDYRSDPAGNAGGRIACGVVRGE